MAVEQSSTHAAAAPARKRRACKTCNVLNLGRRKEDARPLIGEILTICEGINDEGLEETRSYASMTVSFRPLRRKGDARQQLRDIAVMCSLASDAGLARLKAEMLEIAAKHPLTPAQEPVKQTAQVIDLAAWRARRQS